MPFIYRFGPHPATFDGDLLVGLGDPMPLETDVDGLLIPPTGFALDADGLVILDFAWQVPPFVQPVPWRVDLCVGWERVATCVAHKFTGTAHRNEAGSFVLEASPEGIPPGQNFDPRDVDTIRLVTENPKRILFPGYVQDDDGGFYEDRNENGRLWRWTGQDAWWLLSQGQALPDPTMESGWIVSHDTRTGIASSVLAAYLEANMGATALVPEPGFQVADEIVGPTVTISARFDRLDELAQRIAKAGDFQVIPEVDFDGTITIRLSAARDLSSIVVFSDKGDLLTSKARFQQREANWVIAGGAGEGTARIFRTASTGETPRRRKFLDVNSLTTGAEVQAAADTELGLNAERYAVTSELTAVLANQAIGFGLRLGDKLGIGIDGRRYSLPIEAVTFDVSPGRQLMTPQFGDAIPDELTALLRKVDNPFTDNGIA